MTDDINVEYNNNKISFRTSKEIRDVKKISMLRETTVEVFSNSTMHGLPQIIKAKSWIIKLIWLTFISISIGSFTSYSVESLYDFWAYKVSTEIR
jgi:hypothetical protein